jgi:ubiquitin-conjugating enzyme E2 J2
MTGVSTTAVQRLRRDAARLAKDPVPYVSAVPLPSNILEWHYVVEGPPDSPYSGGYYHGKLIFPAEYPFKPPSIYMLTPNGRFQINTRLCLSISDFHPDTWNPAWSVATILTGLLSFMLETTATFGSVETSDYEKRAFAGASLAYNLKGKTFRDLFPEICKRAQKPASPIQQTAAAGTSNNSNVNDSTIRKRAVPDKNPTDQNDQRRDNEERDDENRSAEVRAMGEEGENRRANGVGGRNAPETAIVNGDGGGVLNASALSNLLVFIGIVAFIVLAKYVLQSIE